MQSIQDFIPKDKGDTETVERLFSLSYEEVKPIVPELLKWIQDGNWPIAYSVGQYLSTISDYLTAEIVQILQTHDGAWEYQVLRWLVEDRPLKSEVLLELTRIRDTPTQNEIEEDVYELAQHYLREAGS